MISDADINQKKNKSVLSDPKSFKEGLAKIYKDSFPKEFCPYEFELQEHVEQQLLISSFDTEVWNMISNNKIDVYRPPWERKAEER